MQQEKQRAGSGLVYRVVVYFLGNICSKLITFLLTRLQTGALTPATFASANLLATTLPQLVSICFFEIWSGLLRFMYDVKEAEEGDGKHRIFTNVLAASAILLPLFLLSVFFLNRSQGGFYFAELTVMGILYLLDLLYQFSARGYGKNRLFALTGVGASFVLGFSQILFLNVFRLGGISLILSPIMASLFSIVVYELQLKQLRRCRRHELDSTLIRVILKFSFPLAINATAFVALTKFNEFYIQYKMSNTDLGMLTAANKIAMTVNIFISVFSLAWQETAFSVSSDKNRHLYYSQTLKQYATVLMCGIFLLLPCGRLVFRILVSSGDNGSYDPAVVLIPMSLISVGISALSNFMGHIYSAEKRNDQLFYSTLVGAAVNIPTMILLLPRLGLQAANTALTIGFLATFLYRYFMLQSIVRVRLPGRLAVVGLAGLAVNSFLFYCPLNPLQRFIWLLVSCLIVLLMMRRDLSLIFTALRKKLRKED